MSSPNLKPAGLVLFHGAGGDKDHPTLVAIEESLDIAVFRHNFPYRDKNPGKPSGPNGMKTLVATVNNAVVTAAQKLEVKTNRILVGGRSLGGRAASVAVSEGLDAAGLVLLSYPLHPPGKPEKLRTEHFPQIGCPMVIIQGKSDPFGRPPEVKEHFAIFGPDATVLEVKGAHGPKGQDSEITSMIQTWIDSYK